MRVTNNRTSLQFNLTEDEVAALGHPDRLTIMFTRNSDPWAIIERRDSPGGTKLGINSNNAGTPYRAAIIPEFELPLFGTEEVACRTLSANGKATLLVTKPQMTAKLKRGNSSGKVVKALPAPDARSLAFDLDKIKALVREINDVIAAHPDLQLLLNQDGRLKIRLQMEIGDE